MKYPNRFLLISFSLLLSAFLFAQGENQNADEPFRPQIHFSPPAHWMNDPNGMVFYKRVYHLFYQYHPHSSVWGPMHWGYATSKNMIHWNHQPIALYPDSLGMIFSGSAVVDKKNTTGFGSKRKKPLVAIYTQHDADGEKAGRTDFQTQSIAYSPDNGKNWIKYQHNPVLKNPGIKDFRDPKVMWHDETNRWIMTLAVADRIKFYSSPDLKSWTEESEFGKTIGAHGGVWECPDLFTLNESSKKVWVLIVNLNPGGPNGGSATQYFVGDFDGKKFIPLDTITRWLDYGPDEYAGVTWSNTGKRKIFFGWMSNWLYGQVVPTETWRSAMTIPRELKLIRSNNDYRVTSEPVKELSRLQTNSKKSKNIRIEKYFNLANLTGEITVPCRLNLDMDTTNDFSVILSNENGDETIIGYESGKNQYYIDRTKSGITDFHKEFAAKLIAPRLANDNGMKLTLIIDVSSVELFADEGLTVMTGIFFPRKTYHKITFRSTENIVIKKLEYFSLKSIR
jgi:fructan beta-fructosidase